MGDETTTEGLIELLDSIREEAAAKYEEAIPPHFQIIQDKRLDEMALTIESALKSHPAFRQEFSRYFLGTQLGFWPQAQAHNLIRVVVERGAAGAIDWFQKVRSVTSAEMEVWAEVHGLNVERRLSFSNGVTVIPLHELDDRPHMQSLKAQSMIFPGMPIPLELHHPSAALLEVENVQGSTDHTTTGHDKYLETVETIRRTLNALTLGSQAAATVGTSWSYFKDGDLAGALHGRTWQGAAHDGRHNGFPDPITDEMIEWVERYLALPASLKSLCDVGLGRLNLARRRVQLGDKAIEGSICLEALLSGRGRGELTHKLKLRTALLLGKDLEERQRIAGDVGKFYDMRSKVVHGVVVPNGHFERELVGKGLALCRQVLEAVILRGTMPDPELWELLGGPD